ncbi:hypothetical protein [Sphingomonas phage Carli]|nr:hypothetical protein [Sphingomonas phage Carli]
MAIPATLPLSAEDRTLWEGRLKEAQAAYHDLATGQAVASFTDQNGERVTYSKGDKWLPGYIADMVALLGVAPTPFTSTAPRPIRFIF